MKSSSPFGVIFRAAMGHCSALPGENQNRSDYVKHQVSNLEKSRRSSTSTPPYGKQERDDSTSRIRMKRDEGDNDPLAAGGEQLSADSKTPLMAKRGEDTNNFFLNVVRQGGNAFEPYIGNKKNSTTEYSTSHYSQNGSEFKENQFSPSHHSRRRSSRDSSVARRRVPKQRPITPPEPIAQPPENAVRLRCYRLNLDSSIEPSFRTQCGPIESRNRMLQLSISEDSSVAGGKAQNTAVSTAQIFRGLTITKDGTVISKKSGRSRSTAPNGKTDEKSRQAAKIDKAKDLVEESANGKVDRDEDTKMVSLVIMGEYDDMKNLVRDGSKRLKDSEGLPDEALLSLNVKRLSVSSDNILSPISPTRKRSPHPQAYSPVKVKQKSPVSGNNATSSMPKLKENPRDTRPRAASSHSKKGSRIPHEKCNTLPIFGGDNAAGWSDTLGLNFHSIWTCGGRKGNQGTVSPINENLPLPAGRVAYYRENGVERRDEASLGHRNEASSVRAWNK